MRENKGGAPQTNILERLRSEFGSFSKSHQKVANYILEHYDKAIFLTSFKMGQNCGVSESSVIRFATTLGYSGFSEMQRDLQDLLKSQITMTQRLREIPADSGGNATILHSIMQKGMEGIERALTGIDESSFERTVALLSNSRRVFLVGSRSSYGLVYFFGFVLNWIREGVHIINGSGNSFDCFASLTRDDMVLAISLPRYPKSTIHAMEIAHAKGAHTISITDTVTSPLVSYSEIPLLVHTEMLSYSDNVAPVMCLITALLTAVGAFDCEKTAASLEMYEKFWTETGVYY